MRIETREAAGRVRTPSRESDYGSLVDAEIIDAAPTLQYGGSTFSAASEYLRALRDWDKPVRVRLTRAITDAGGRSALVQELRGLHGVSVALTDSPAGRFIACHLAATQRGVPWNCLAQGVLLLPPTFAAYMRGRARQALRTNNRAAAAAGITCRKLERDTVVETFERWSQEGVLPAKVASNYLPKVPNGFRDARWYVALDAASAPIGFARVWFDSEWALVAQMVCVSHPARWLLHTHVVEDLYAAGVSRLFVSEGNALRMSPSLQYFQGRLGYRVAHLIPKPSPRFRLAAVRPRSSNRAPGRMSRPIAGLTTLAAIVPPW